MGRLIPSFFVGLFAMNIALACGVIFWRHWPPGDAADIGLTAAFATYALLGFFVRPTADNTPDQIDRAIGIGGAADREGR